MPAQPVSKQPAIAICNRKFWRAGLVAIALLTPLYYFAGQWAGTRPSPLKTFLFTTGATISVLGGYLFYFWIQSMSAQRASKRAAEMGRPVDEVIQFCPEWIPE